MSLHPHSLVCYDIKQWGSVSAQQSLQFHTHLCMRPLMFFYSCVSHLSVSLIPALLLLPFPHPLCVGAKPSNGCWHILEPCCPTCSLSCAGQVHGSAQCNLAVDETNAQKQLARSPTTASRAAHFFRSQVKSRGLFISRGAKPTPSEGFRSANARHKCCRRTKQNKNSETQSRVAWSACRRHPSHLDTCSLVRKKYITCLGEEVTESRAEELGYLLRLTLPSCQRQWPSTHRFCSGKERKQTEEKQITKQSKNNPGCAGTPERQRSYDPNEDYTKIKLLQSGFQPAKQRLPLIGILLFVRR